MYRYIESPLYNTNCVEVIAKLQEKYKLLRDAIFNQLNSHYNKINLDDYSNITKYINAFTSVIAELKEINMDITVSKP